MTRHVTGARMRRLALVAVAAATAVAASTASAAPVPLPSVLVQITLQPPFATPVTGGENEGIALRFPARSTQRVTIGVDATGKPYSVRVHERLVLLRSGDYSFVIGAPVEDVRGAPGSESEPGLRTGAILWAGFSPGRKVLAANAVLRPREAAPVLPLRVSVTRSGDGVRVRLRNATRVSARSIGGNAAPLDAARALDAVRSQGANAQARQVIVDFLGTPAAVQTTVTAPLQVRGSVAFPAGALAGTRVEGGTVRGDTVAIDTVLGDETPIVHDVLVRGVDALPKLQLVVTPQAPLRALEPPAGGSWVEFVRGRRVSGRELIARAVSARLAFARARQYQTFLFDPDPLGPRSATYRYVTGKPPPRVTAPTAVDDGGRPWLPFVLVPVALAAATGLVVLWAHS